MMPGGESFSIAWMSDSRLSIKDLNPSTSDSMKTPSGIPGPVVSTEAGIDGSETENPNTILTQS